MLNNLRNKFDPLFDKVGRAFASLGFGPNFWTWIGLVLSIISAIMFSLHSPAIGVDWYTSTFLGSLFLIIAGFFDAVDGAVARVTNRTTKLGAFLDSLLDKVSETVVFVGILIGNFTNPVLVLVALSLSLLVSYTRAQASSLNVNLQGKGIAERAERILIISILGFIPFLDNISVALWILSILSVVTVLQRIKIVSASLGTPFFSMQTFSEMFTRNGSGSSSISHSPQAEGRNTFSNPQKYSGPSSSDTSFGKNIKGFFDKAADKVSDNKTNTSSSSSKSSPSTTFSNPQTKGTSNQSASQDKVSASQPPSSYSPPPPPPPPPAPPSPQITKPTMPQFLEDRTDPNETGRNVAQLIFEQENEDKKTINLRTPPPPPPSPESPDAPKTAPKTAAKTTTETKEQPTQTNNASSSPSTTTETKEQPTQTNNASSSPSTTTEQPNAEDTKTTSALKKEDNESKPQS
ncbi:MAG: CDP-alcohol phosphatidyltransferase family protein [Thermoproteota archaeon]|nr:CDP-alcohol phosphatidyltransferase family protein [Thermoproteota archaeon]